MEEICSGYDLEGGRSMCTDLEEAARFQALCVAFESATTPDSEEMVGRYIIYKWDNVDGVKVVRYGVTKGRGHSIIPDEMKMLWSWYELWQKDAEGNNVYVGP